ncbi:Uncharacterized protein dnm_026450 [Desulfonema magnum]|uniref:Uncharacterized protein n=1 Tax=Desulfonema magnum TaxID=45655 RepID=A0A975GM78_9BACT|nr:Uncharacterized protein dnm_026450 [Desulfonema magnum]
MQQQAHSPPDRPNAVDFGNSEQIRSAKIIFLRLRKSIFRTPEKIPENPLTLKSTVLPDRPRKGGLFAA